MIKNLFFSQFHEILNSLKISVIPLNKTTDFSPVPKTVLLSLSLNTTVTTLINKVQSRPPRILFNPDLKTM